MVTYPTDWATYSFEQIFQIVSNNTLSRDKLTEHGRIGNIHYGDVLIKYGAVLTERDSIPRIKPEFESYAGMQLAKDDVIVADTAEDDTVGKVVQIGNVSCPLVGGLHTIVCRPLVQTASGYLGYYMNSKEYHEQLLPYITGIKVSSVSKSSIRKTQLHIPESTDEQAAIVSVISDFDSAIDNLNELIEKKKAIRDGALNDLLSGRTRLAGFSGKLCNKALGAIVKVERGKRLVRNQLAKQGAFPVYQNSMEPLGYYVQYNCEPDSTFIIAAGSAGETGFSKCAFWAADDCYYFKHCPDLSQQYLYYLLLYKQSYLKEQSRRTSIPRLSRDVIDGLEVCMHSIDEQKAIAESLSAIDEEIKALGAEREKILQIREGTMNDLLTGRVRLNV